MFKPLSLVLLGTALAAPLPQNPMDAIMGPAQTGKFGQGGIGAPPTLSVTGIYQMANQVSGMAAESSGGTGPYKSVLSATPGLERHTMYMPTNVPAGIKVPVIVWGNGACSGNGAWFSKFLNEVASHGFLVIANGAPDGSLVSGSKAEDLTDAIEWVYKNAGQAGFANVDRTRLAAAGQSCGGVQAFSASLDKRVTVTGIFNSGLLNPENTKFFADLHAPVGFFLGGPTDIAYVNASILDQLMILLADVLTQGERDYKNMPDNIPTLKANLPVGHMATYGETNGGQYGKAATLFFKWQLQDDQAAGQEFLNPTSLKAAGWDIVSKGFK